MKKTLLLFAVISLLSFVSCSNKDQVTEDGSTAKVQLVLTDAPAVYDAVNINIKEVKINMGARGSEGNWINYPLNTDAGIQVNLLDLSNGRSMYMGDPFALPAGNISQIRLVLGDGNTVVIDGTSYPLSTPSAQESGLKINFTQTLQPGGIYKIWLDFDAARSIVHAGNSGIIHLKPVIKANLELATSGAIRGIVLPAAAATTIYLLKGADTIASALPEKTGSLLGEGYFKFVNLVPGAYSLSFNASDNSAYKDFNINNIAVSSGNITDVNTVTLQH